MTTRELILLSHNRLPAQNTLMIGDAEAAAFLNGFTVLWHPAAVLDANAPPHIGSPYDHEQPTAGHVYAVIENPTTTLPDDWTGRVRDSKAVAFSATPDRKTTLENLQTALAGSSESTLWSLSAEQVAPFFAIGFGLLIVDGLFEAAGNQNIIPRNELWQDVQEAVKALPNDAVCRGHLQAAAEKLQRARETIGPATINLVDLCLLDVDDPARPLPASFSRGLPLNLVTCGAVLEKMAREQPDTLGACEKKGTGTVQAVKTPMFCGPGPEPVPIFSQALSALALGVKNNLVDVCGGSYVERADAWLPLESQLWNLLKGLAVSEQLLGQKTRVFARRRFGAHPQMPLFLSNVGIQRALLVPFDESTLPSYQMVTVNWPSPGGKQVDAFTRTPYAAESPQTYFHLAHYLHQAIKQDHTATLALLHKATSAPSWYGDLLELSRLGAVLGQWTTLSQILDGSHMGQYNSAPAADEFHGDYLSERVAAHDDRPVSWFAQQVRWRRQLDTVWTIAALQRSLNAGLDKQTVNRLLELEDRLETAEEWGVGSGEWGAGGSGESWESDLETVQKGITEGLAQRLLARATGNTRGYLLLNPCSFTRRFALELDNIAGPLPLGGPLKTCQVEGGRAKVLAEVPALGFAWIPGTAPAGTPSMPMRMKLADRHCVRNEFLEAEVDPHTGGLKAIRDHRSRGNRLGQQLIFNPGSTMRAAEVRVTSAGPALGEIISEGALMDDQEKVLATFRQRFRAWLGRPVLDLRVEISPRHSPAGYPWHAYYGARFAWRDERATMLRGVNGIGAITTSTRRRRPTM